MSGGAVALVGSAAVVAAPIERAETPRDATFDAQLEATIGVEAHEEARRAKDDAEQVEGEEGSEDDEEKPAPQAFADVAAVVDRISANAWDLSLGSPNDESGSSSGDDLAQAEPSGDVILSPLATAGGAELATAGGAELATAGGAELATAEGTQQADDAMSLDDASSSNAPGAATAAQSQAKVPAILEPKLANRAERAEGDSPKAKKKPSIDPPADAAMDATRVGARMEDLISQAQLAPVDKPADAGVKPMTRDAMSRESPSLREATEEGKGAERVRAAEALGHRHALASTEAHGHIVDAELGRVEVRARAEHNRIDVQIRAEEARTRQVIAASAADLNAHVHREVPNAVIQIERSISDFQAQNALADGERRGTDGQSSGSGPRDGNSTHDGSESVIGARIPMKGGRVRFVL